MELGDSNSFGECDNFFSSESNDYTIARPSNGSFTDFLNNDDLVLFPESSRSGLQAALISDLEPRDEICSEIIEQYGVSPYHMSLEELDRIMQTYREGEISQHPEPSDAQNAPVATGSNPFSGITLPMDPTLSGSISDEQISECDDIKIAEDDTPLPVDLAFSSLEDQGSTESTVMAGKQTVQTPGRNLPMASEQKATIRRRKPAEKWKEMRKIIEHVYISQEYTLKDTKKYLERNYQFFASEKSYKEKFRGWGLVKNLTKRHYIYMLNVARKRKAEENKETTFTYLGDIVSVKKLERAGRRHTASSSIHTVPPHISYYTPDSSVHQTSRSELVTPRPTSPQPANQRPLIHQRQRGNNQQGRNDVRSKYMDANYHI